jgi:hypothetical protein
MGGIQKLQSILIPLAAMIVGAAFCAVLLYFWRSGRELRSKGVTTQGVVSKKFRKGGGLENFYALVSFIDLSGRSHVVEMKVASRVWRGWREGETVDITYLPSQPEKAEQGPKWGRKLIAGALLFMAAIGALMSVTGLVQLIKAIVSVSAEALRRPVP